MRTSDWVREFNESLLSSRAAEIRLALLTETLFTAHRELALTVIDEKQKRREIYATSQENSVSGRDREADLYVHHEQDEIIRMKGDIAAYSEERDHLRFLIEHGSLHADVDELHPAGS